MTGQSGDINRQAGCQANGFIVADDYVMALDDLPVLGSMLVAPDAQPPAGFDHNPFNLVIGFLRQQAIVTPRSMVLTVSQYQSFLIDARR